MPVFYHGRESEADSTARGWVADIGEKAGDPQTKRFVNIIANNASKVRQLKPIGMSGGQQAFSAKFPGEASAYNFVATPDGNGGSSIELVTDPYTEDALHNLSNDYPTRVDPKDMEDHAPLGSIGF